MKKMGIALLIGICLLMAGCQQGTQVEAPELLEPVGVKTDRQAAYVGELSRITTYDAAIVPYVESLSLEVDGTVKHVNVIVGQQVKKGDVLVELDQSDLEEAYESYKDAYEHAVRMNEYTNQTAELDLQILEAELNKLSSQNEGGVNAQAIRAKKQQIEEKRLSNKQIREEQALEIASLKAVMEEAKSKLGKHQIIAPFDGRVIYGKQITVGTYVSAYENLVFLADDDRVHVEGEYLSDLALRSAHRLYALVGGYELDLVARPVDQEEYLSVVLSGGKMTSKYDFAQEMPEDLESGMYVAICLESSYVEDALLIPTNALLRDATGRYVYVYEDDGETRTRRDVSIGIMTDWLVQITEGLEEGEVVYVSD